MSGKERRDTAGRIIEENLDYLVRFAYYRLGSRDDAEDVVYDSVLRFLEKSPDDVRPEGVRLYLYRIVHNLCVDRSRGGKFVVVPVDGLDVEDRAEDVLDLEDADRVNACLDSLPAREADVIRMNVVDNLSFVEIWGVMSWRRFELYVF